MDRFPAQMVTDDHQPELHVSRSSFAVRAERTVIAATVILALLVAGTAAVSLFVPATYANIHPALLAGAIAQDAQHPWLSFTPGDPTGGSYIRRS